MAGERVDGALRGVPAQGQARQVRQAADEVAVAVAEREERGVGDHMLVVGEGVPVAGPVGEPGEGQVGLHCQGRLVAVAALQVDDETFGRVALHRSCWRVVGGESKDQDGKERHHRNGRTRHVVYGELLIGEVGRELI